MTNFDLNLINHHNNFRLAVMKKVNTLLIKIIEYQYFETI